MIATGCASGGSPEADGQKRANPPGRDPVIATEANPEAEPNDSCGILSQESVNQLEDKVSSFDSQVAVGLLESERPVLSIGYIDQAYARSTIKVVILAALLDEVGGRQGLSRADINSAGLAIRDSDNEAARALYESLAEEVGGEAAAAQAMNGILREGGDPTTVVPETTPSGLPPSFISNYGATLWPVEAQASFMRGLLNLEVLDEESTAFILTLMGEITTVGGSSWGFGSLDSGLDPRYKPGWGDNPDGKYLARQMGAISLSSGEEEVSISIASIGSSQDDAYSRATEAIRLLVGALSATCS